MGSMPNPVQHSKTQNTECSDKRGYFGPRAYLRKATLQLEFFFQYAQLGRKRLLKHSLHSYSFRFGTVASNNKNSGCALLIISIQLYFGTIVRRLRFARSVPYSPRRSLRRIGRRHGLSAGSEMIPRSLRDKPDKTIRDCC